MKKNSLKMKMVMNHQKKRIQKNKIFMKKDVYEDNNKHHHQFC